MRNALIVSLVFLWHQAQAQLISNLYTNGGSPGAGYKMQVVKKNKNQTFYWLYAGCDTLFQNKIPLCFKSSIPQHDFPWSSPNSAFFILFDSLNNVQQSLQFSASHNIVTLDAQQTPNGDFLLTYQIPNDSLYLNGNLIIADSTLKYGAFCLSKVSPTGEIIFTRCFPGNQIGGSVGRGFIGQLDEGKIALAGHVFQEGNIVFDSFALPCIGCHAEDSDVFVAILDSMGHTLNAKRFGGASEDYLWDMKISPENDIYMTGSFYTGDFYYDTLHLHNYLNWISADAYLLKIDASLNPIWIKQAGSLHTEEGKSIEFDQAGNVYWGGNFCCSKVFFGADTVLGGFTNSFIRKITADGQVLWTKVFASGDYQSLFDMAWSDDGSIWAALQFMDSLVLDNISIPGLGNYDAALVQLDADGNMLRYFSMGTAGWERIFSIQSLNDHQLFVTGTAALNDGDSLQFLNMTLHNWYNHTGPDFGFVLNLLPLETKTPDARQHDLVIMPNPVRKGGVIRIENPEAQAGNISIFDTAGRIIWQANKTQGSTSFEIPAPNHPGFFYIRLQTDKWRSTQKVVVID